MTPESGAAAPLQSAVVTVPDQGRSIGATPTMAEKPIATNVDPPELSPEYESGIAHNIESEETTLDGEEGAVNRSDPIDASLSSGETNSIKAEEFDNDTPIIQSLSQHQAGGSDWKSALKSSTDGNFAEITGPIATSLAGDLVSLPHHYRHLVFPQHTNIRQGDVGHTLDHLDIKLDYPHYRSHLVDPTVEYGAASADGERDHQNATMAMLLDFFEEVHLDYCRFRKRRLQEQRAEALISQIIRYDTEMRDLRKIMAELRQCLATARDEAHDAQESEADKIRSLDKAESAAESLRISLKTWSEVGRERFQRLRDKLRARKELTEQLREELEEVHKQLREAQRAQEESDEEEEDEEEGEEESDEEDSVEDDNEEDEEEVDDGSASSSVCTARSGRKVVEGTNSRSPSNTKQQRHHPLTNDQMSD